MVRHALLRSFVALAALALSPWADSWDRYVDRPGNDYKSIYPVQTSRQCEQACNSESECAAWTHVSIDSRCWLKNRVSAPILGDWVSSGIKRSDDYLGPGVDLPGNDYRGVDMATGSPALCRQLCEEDKVCGAWTYVRPKASTLGRCQLKTSVPPARPDSCCESGARSFDGIERGMDRPGADIANMDLAEAEPALCRLACEKNASCEAWTYVKPGVQGDKARCWLKNAVPVASENGCCSSGIKRIDTWSTRYNYAQACAAEMGALPDFNCMDGDLLPITSVKASVIYDDEGVGYYGGAGFATMPLLTCDRPPILGLAGPTQCMPWSRLLRLRTDKPDVETAVICRKYWPSAGPDWSRSAGISDSRFDDIAVVQHDKKTGNTCFYQSRLNGNGNAVWVDGNRVPSPMKDTAAARDVWLETKRGGGGPGEVRCTECHAGGPFILSPYIAQKANPANWNPLGKYDPDRFGIFGGPKPTTIAPDGNKCVSCHRIGTESWDLIGRKIATATIGPEGDRDDGYIYYNYHFMPIPFKRVSNADWLTLYDAHVKQLEACALSPSTPGCNVK